MILIMLDEIFDALRGEADAPTRAASGALLFARDDRVGAVILLEQGEVKLSRSLMDGQEMVLHRVRGASLVAEASIYSSTYHCDAICLSSCLLRIMTKRQFLRVIEGNGRLSSLWSAHLARCLQDARFRSEILTMKKVADRLDAWLDWHVGGLPSKGGWNDLAAEIGVSPEALYRELANRRGRH